MEKKYVVITVGPIFDTINLTSSPAALWAASYLFSSLTKHVCKCLTENYGVSEEQIVSPYYAKDDDLLHKNNGIGLFHDRIIFRADNFDAQQMPQVRRDAITAVAKDYGISAEYLNEYLMVAWASFEAENPITGSTQLLDCLELSKRYVFKEETNPILDLFVNASTAKNGSGEDEYAMRLCGKNEAVKKLTTGLDNFQLRADATKLKSLEDITKTGSGFKKYKYYVILRSDGDKMGEIIKNLKNDEEIRDFSKNCLFYCSALADKVAGYGGVTIYSGGDDLLAIMPCQSGAGTVFDFVAEANESFKECFAAYGRPTSLSFGVTIAYNRFPLYEALEDSANMLFGYAKKMRNCIAVRLQKHAGQSESLLISNDAFQRMSDPLHQVLEEKDDVLLSAMHKLTLFKKAFGEAKDETTIKNLFANTFDAEDHKNNSFVHEALPNALYALKTQGETSGIYAITDEGIQKDDPVLTLHYMLRMMKFFVEKEGSGQ